MTGNSNSNKQIILSYARALFAVAEQINMLEEIKEQFNALAALFRADQTIAKILASPLIKFIKKKDVIETLSKEYKLSQEMLSFLEILILNNRFLLINDMLDRYISLLNEKKGNKQIGITSYLPLKSEERKSLISLLEHSFKCKILLSEKVDSSILGGLVIADGTKIYDASVSNKIKRLEKISKQEIYTISTE